MTDQSKLCFFFVSSQSSYDFGVNRGLCSTGMRQNLQVGNTSPVDSTVQTVQWDDLERIRLCLFQEVERKPLENHSDTCWHMVICWERSYNVRPPATIAFR